MNVLKLFRFVVPMAVSLALCGTTSASATELFSGATTQAKGSKVTASLEPGTTSSLADTSGNPIETCTTSSFEWEITGPGSSASTVSGPGKHLTFSGEGCNVTVDQSKNGSFEVHHVAGGKNGTLTGVGFHVAMHVFNTTCTYGLGAGIDLGTFTGSTTGNATIDVNAIVTRQTGSFLCPSSAKWTASYAVTSPSPLHVTEGLSAHAEHTAHTEHTDHTASTEHANHTKATELSAELFSGETTQPKGTKLTASLTSGTTSSLTDTVGNPIETCTSSSVEWELSKAGGSATAPGGPVKHLTFSGEGCNVTVDQSKNGSLEVHRIAAGKNGTLTGSGFSVAIHVFGTTCTYGLGEQNDLGTFTGSTTGNARIDINTIVPRVAGSFLCPSTGKWTASYDVTSPSPLHVTEGISQHTEHTLHTAETEAAEQHAEHTEDTEHALHTEATDPGTELFSGEVTQAKGSKVTASLESGTTSLLADTSSNLIETCTSSSVEWEISSPGSTTSSPSGPVKHLTFGGEGCNVTVDQSKNGSLEVHHIAGGKNGTLTGSGFHMAMHVLGTTCTYGLGAQTDLGTVTGSTTGNATIDVNAIVTRQTGSFVCPSSAKWTASYTVTSPTPLHVTGS